MQAIRHNVQAAVTNLTSTAGRTVATAASTSARAAYNAASTITPANTHLALRYPVNTITRIHTALYNAHTRNPEVLTTAFKLVLSTVLAYAAYAAYSQLNECLITEGTLGKQRHNKKFYPDACVPLHEKYEKHPSVAIAGDAFFDTLSEIGYNYLSPPLAAYIALNLLFLAISVPYNLAANTYNSIHAAITQ